VSHIEYSGNIQDFRAKFYRVNVGANARTMSMADMKVMSDADLEEQARTIFRKTQKRRTNWVFVRNTKDERFLGKLFCGNKPLSERQVNFSAVVMIARDAEKERAKFAPTAWRKCYHSDGASLIKIVQKIRPQIAPFISQPIGARPTAEFSLAMQLVGLYPSPFLGPREWYPIAPPNPAGVSVRKGLTFARHYCAKCRRDYSQTKWHWHLDCHE
jgi:hypothetical protein